jgi:hypothetical protein
MTSRSFVVANPREAHQVLTELFQQEIKPHTAKGRRGRLIWQTESHYRRHQLRKLFHGVVLRDIAEQVWVRDPITGCRVRYVPLVWKRHCAELFIEPDFEEYTTRDGEIKVRERRRSTEALSDDDFAEFLLQVLAYACLDWNVEFSEQPERDSHA